MTISNFTPTTREIVQWLQAILEAEHLEAGAFNDCGFQTRWRYRPSMHRIAVTYPEAFDKAEPRVNNFIDTNKPRQLVRLQASRFQAVSIPTRENARYAKVALAIGCAIHEVYSRVASPPALSKTSSMATSSGRTLSKIQFEKAGLECWQTFVVSQVFGHEGRRALSC